MKTTRELVLAYFLALPELGFEQFNQGFALLRNADGRNLAQERHLNKLGYNENTLATVHYELKKLFGITESELRRAIAKKETPSRLQVLVAAALSVGVSLLLALKLWPRLPLAMPISSDLEAFRVNGMEALEAFGKAHDLDPDIELPQLLDALAPDLEALSFPDELLQELQDNDLLKITNSERDAKVVQLFAAAPTEVKEGIKFRDEFPFLNDADCPDAFKILTSDKFAAYHKFVDAHEELKSLVIDNVDPVDDSHLFHLAKEAVANFTLDQAIYDEFVHYRDKGEILGKHPIFRRAMLEKSVAALKGLELSKRKGNLENYIRGDRGMKKLEKETDPAKKAAVQEKIDLWKEELELVTTALDVEVNAAEAK